MIKFGWEGSATVEGEADELVAVTQVFMAHLARIIGPRPVSVGVQTKAAPAAEPPAAPASAKESPPTVAPDAPWVDTEPAEVPSSDGPIYARATEEQLAEGADLWMGLLTTWQQGFMDPEAEQPDRLDVLSRSMSQGGGRMFGVLYHYGGLTMLVRSLMPGLDKRTARRMAENIASVSSAAGVPVISDQLEYTSEYLGEEYKHEG